MRKTLRNLLLGLPLAIGGALGIYYYNRMPVLIREEIVEGCKVKYFDRRNNSFPQSTYLDRKLFRNIRTETKKEEKTGDIYTDLNLYEIREKSCIIQERWPSIKRNEDYFATNSRKWDPAKQALLDILRNIPDSAIAEAYFRLYSFSISRHELAHCQDGVTGHSDLESEVVALLSEAEESLIFQHDLEIFHSRLLKGTRLVSSDASDIIFQCVGRNDFDPRAFYRLSGEEKTIRFRKCLKNSFYKEFMDDFLKKRSSSYRGR